MNYKKYIKKELIKILPGTNIFKKDVINELVNMIPDVIEIKNIEELRKGIFYREKLMSTGVGLGIGIPHVRFEGVNEPILVVGIQPKGVKDYESMDNKPVRVIILIIVEKFQHKMHLKILGQIIEKLKADQIISKLIKAKDNKEIYNILVG